MAKYDRLSWISTKNSYQEEWAKRYLTKRQILPKQGRNYPDELATWVHTSSAHQFLLELPCNAASREIIKEMKAAWGQVIRRKSAKSNGTRGFNYELNKVVHEQLKHLAKSQKLSVTSTIEALVTFQYAENSKRILREREQIRESQEKRKAERIQKEKKRPGEAFFKAFYDDASENAARLEREVEELKCLIKQNNEK